MDCLYIPVGCNILDLVALLSFALAGSMEGAMDYVNFKYNGPSRFWNTRHSWKNKWKLSFDHGLETVIVGTERFWLSSTVLVFLTDGWHLLKWIRNRMIDLSIFCIIPYEWYISLIFVLCARVAYGICFEICFVSLSNEKD